MALPGNNAHERSWLDAWHVNPSSNREYDFIDGLRGIAILMVLCDHYIYVNPHSGPAVQYLGGLARAGGGGVQLFFILSGFLISWPFWKRKFAQSEEIIPRGYGRRRFWKIYPPMALTVAIFTPVYILRTHDWSYLHLAAQWLAGIHFILPASGKLNAVMWTLVVEVQFYIILPVVFFSIRKVSPKISWWIVTLVFLVIPTTFQAVTGLSPTVQPEINSHFPSTLSFFYLGILVAGLASQGLLKKSWANLGMAGAVLWPITLFTLAWINAHPEFNRPGLQIAGDWMERIASGFLLLYVANPRHPVARILCAPWLRWCGVISYEWYLIHQPIVSWNRSIFGPAGGDPGRYAAIVGGSLLLSIIMAALVYRYFSLPILKYGRASK